ncbi:hypothetical protein [Chryseobacterium arthrosphaerae]|uniref:hypothetical protein n=1 Tax=Chryseobacterium arthrosphaerae TaxID=651561 RepID=UPI001E358126|nr:hypothetical protein [Chryseobacterium arthrosphaerae]UEQ78219.1 hypothetical protein J8N07_07980 [Chryseobacterium arthrosphaerae]
MKAATVDKNSKAHLSPGKKPKPKEQVVVPLSGVEEISVQTKKSENSTDRAGSANPESNRMGLNNIMASAHSSQTIHGKGSEIMYDKLQESLSVTGDINHPDTKKIEKNYMMTLSPSQARDYHDLKSGTYQTKTVQERAVVHQIVKNQKDPVKTTRESEKETLQKTDSKSEASKPVIDEKPKEKAVEIKTAPIKPISSEVNSNSSKKVADKNEKPRSEKATEGKKTINKKLNSKTKGEEETKVTIPDEIQSVVTPRMDKAVDSEQAEIAPDAQTTINIVGLVAAAQEFRDQGVEARNQVKSQNEAAKTLKNKIKEVEREIQKSDDDLQKSEDSIDRKEALIHKLEKGLDTSLKRQQKVEQEVGTYQQEYDKNKTKASDLDKEAKSLLGGSQKHQDPKNADSGKLTKKLSELNTNAGTINQAVSQAGNTTRKLSQEAQQAKGKNTRIKSEITSSRASVQKSKAKLAADTKKNIEAKKELVKLTPKLKQAESESKKLNQEANALLLDSYVIEHEIIKTQNAYYANMATIEGRNSLIQKEKDKIQQTPKELNEAERLLVDFTQLKTEDEQIVFLRQLSPGQRNLLRDKFEEVNANYDSDQSEHQSLISQNVESIRNSQIEVFNNKRKDALQKPLSLVTKNLNRITGLKRLWMSISIAFSDIWNDITNISWTDVGKFIESIFSPKAWYEAISGSISGIWDDLTSWKGFSQDPVGMILQKAAGIANKVLIIAGVITGILGVLTLAAAVGSIFTLGGLAPLAAWLGAATITMGTITFWIGAIALGLNILNGIKNIYDVHTAKTAEVLFKNSGELKSDIANSGMAILAMMGGKASKKGGASIKDLAKRNPKTFGKRVFITARNGLKAQIVSIPRRITSVFKKETWIKASQRFQAAYKKAQEWGVEPFRKKTVTPPSRNMNQLPFEEQTVPDRMHEQPVRNEKNSAKSNIKEENVTSAPVQENLYEESIFRQDNRPYSPEGSKEGRIKSHINEEGNLTPADKNGSATVSDHVRGSEPMKSKSPYTSFSDEGPGIGKTYGDNVIEVDIKRLESDIAAGRITEVEVLRPEKVQAELQDKIDQAMKRFEESPTPKNQKRVDDAVRDLKNSVRDKEILIKGEIPAEYFNVKSTKNNIFEKTLPDNENIGKSTNKFVDHTNRQSLAKDKNNIINTSNGKKKGGYTLQPKSSLKERQLSILEKLPKSGDYIFLPKKSVAMKDLLKITNVTGDEFNMFTLGSRRLIIRGEGTVIRVPDKQFFEDLTAGRYGKFSGHTHPPGYDVKPGPADRPFLIDMKQEKSGIWGNTSDHPYIFGRTTADDVVIGVKKDQSYYDELF